MTARRWRIFLLTRFDGGGEDRLTLYSGPADKVQKAFGLYAHLTNSNIAYLGDRKVSSQTVMMEPFPENSVA